MDVQEQVNLQLLSLQATVNEKPYPGHIDDIRRQVELVIELFTLLRASNEQEPAEMYLCPYCGQYHPIGAKDWYCPLDPNKPKR